MTRGSGARLLAWSGSKLHPIAPSDREIASLESEEFFLAACLQQDFSVQPIDVSRSLRQHESTKPVAQQNAQPKPPSHIVSAMIERLALFISLFISMVDGLCTAKIIGMFPACVDTHDQSRSIHLKRYAVACPRVFTLSQQQREDVSSAQRIRNRWMYLYAIEDYE